jgi:hypothetical protein
MFTYGLCAAFLAQETLSVGAKTEATAVRSCRHE